MITKNIKRILRVGTACCAVAAALVACSDTWDEHYEGTVDGVIHSSLWTAIQQNPELSNFASVLEATGYDKSLGSSQVFTVFAPTNASFSQAEAAKLIEQYNKERQTVNDDENTVIKEFVQNHIALYNRSVSSLTNDSILLMNRKYALLKQGQIDRSHFLTSNQVYDNGVLFTLDNVIDFSSNIFEYLRKDPDLDSVRSFLYNPLFYHKEFDAESSVEGGLDSLGRTVYLDSVFIQRNELFSYLGRLNTEDSTYWALFPTNDVWQKLVDEYSQYFVYDDKVGDLLTEGDPDSLAYTNARLAILDGTTFSRTTNELLLSRKKTSTTLNDSVYSLAAPLDYTYRQYYWGANFNYYMYYNPLDPERGVLAESDSIQCSNGQVMKVHDWKIDPRQSFNQWIIVEAEAQNSIQKIGKTWNGKDSVDLAVGEEKSVDNPKYRGKVWSNAFVEFKPLVATQSPTITFNIRGVLSNMGYDIYMVCAPALANDSMATEAQSLPTSMRCTLQYHDKKGKMQSERMSTGDVETAAITTNNSGVATTTGTGMDYILLANDFKFPVASFGLSESDAQVSIFVENRVLNSQITRGTHTRTMRIDCILLVPHGTLEVTDALPEDPSIPQGLWGTPGLLMYPHGKDNPHWFYMAR